MRRMFLHESIYDKFLSALINAYKTITIGDPLDCKNQMGPLHTKSAIREYTEGLEEV
jgi:acyl-CoA reductase-like NAD-dependent aldehyde dehydrogenase